MGLNHATLTTPQLQRPPVPPLHLQSTLRVSRSSVAVAAAAWGVTYEYAQWSAISKHLKLNNVQQLAELDVEHQHVDKQIYAVQ